MPSLTVDLYRKLEDESIITLHHEVQYYNLPSQVLNEIMKYLAIAMQNNLFRIDLNRNDVYAWNRGNELLLLQIGR